MTMLALSLGGITGPITVPGFTTTTSKSFSLAKSQAAFSAKVFDNGYHNCSTHTHTKKTQTQTLNTRRKKQQKQRKWKIEKLKTLSNPLLLAIFNVGPALLRLGNIAGPIGARRNRGDGGREHHAPHPCFLRRREHVHGSLNRRVQKLLLHWNRNGVMQKAKKIEDLREVWLNKTWGSWTWSTMQGEARWKTPAQPRTAARTVSWRRRSIWKRRRRVDAPSRDWRCFVSASSSVVSERRRKSDLT